MTSWRCAWREGHDPQVTDHDTEEDAMREADEIARRGVMAVVYPVEVEG